MHEPANGQVTLIFLNLKIENRCRMIDPPEYLNVRPDVFRRHNTEPRRDPVRIGKRVRL